MEPRPKISLADLVQAAENLQPPPGLIDGAPVFPEAALHQVQQQLADDENAWLTRFLMEALQLAGHPVDEATLPDYGPRLSMRRYPDGTVIVALDAEPKTEHRAGTRGQVLFGVGEATVSLQQGLRITRPILTAEQAQVYEVSYSLTGGKPQPWKVGHLEA